MYPTLLHLLKVLHLFCIVSRDHSVIGVVCCMVVVAELGHVHITMSHYVVLLDYY